MSRRRSASQLADVERALYLGARLTGDVHAAQRGPEVLAKRLVRRRVRRGLLSWLNRRTGL